MNVWRAILLGLALALSVSATGCGGDDVGDGTGEAATPPRLSKDEFIARATAICRRERAELRQETAEYFADPATRKKPPAQRYTIWAQDLLAPTVETEIFRLEALGVPAGEEPALDVMLDVQRLAIDIIATAGRIPSIAAARRHFREADFQYEAFGLLSCANGPKRKS